MAGKYRAYPAYKNSGVEWLGEVPEHWSVMRYKHVLTLFQGAAFKSDDYVEESDVVNVRMGNIKKGGIIDLHHNVKYLPTKYKIDYSSFELQENDLIVAMTDMSPTLDFLAVPAFMSGLDPDKTYLLNQRVGKLIVGEHFNVNYLKYLLLSDELRSQLKGQGLGTVQSNMSSENLYNSLFSAPDLEGQIQIANFLDHETAKIDTLIEKQQQLIKLLQEKRQAVISHAVTKGLNPNAPMRDSGVEWLGEVPEHWVVVPIKYVIEAKKGAVKAGPFGSHLKNSDMEGDYAKVISQANVISKDFQVGQSMVSEGKYAELSGFKIELGDILVTTRGTIGRTAIYDSDELGILHPCLIRVQVDQRKVSPKFLALIVEESGYVINQILISSNSTTIEVIYSENLINTIVCLPDSLLEQNELLQYIEEEKACFDLLVEKAESAIDLMQERRTALISAAVTGKIDVRDWRAPVDSRLRGNDEVAA